MGIHDGHRERVFNKFAKNGFAGLEEHEKLEIILFFSIPRPDTNEIAHRLIDKYHKIANVMDAPLKELEEFKHVTDRTFYLFKMIKEAYITYEIEKTNDKSYLTCSEEFGTYFQLYLANAEVEKLAVMGLNSKGKMLAVDIIGEGDISSLTVSCRKILEFVINSKATEVVVAHNHPGDVAFPSNADIKATVNIKDSLESIGVRLRDHIIVTNDDYCSIAQCKEFNYIFKF